MPDKYKELLTGSPVWLALMSAAGGCLVNYLGVYKQTGKLEIRWLIPDLLTSCFIGWLTWGCLVDWGFSLNEAAAGTAVAGNLGAKVFSIIKYLISQRLGLNPYMNKEPNHGADTRNPQQ